MSAVRPLRTGRFFVGSRLYPDRAVLPLLRGCGGWLPDMVSTGQAAPRVGRVVNRGVNGDEPWQGSHLPDAVHRPRPSSEWLMRSLRPMVHPAAGFLPVAVANVLERRAAGFQAIRHQGLGATMPFQRFSQAFQRGFAFAR